MGRTEDIRRAILEQVPGPSAGITRAVSKRFGITRQAVSYHVRRLISAGLLETAGQTRSRILKPKVRLVGRFRYVLKEVDEDSVWRNDVRPLLLDLPPNLLDIWHYATTEIVNNAIDHSDSEWIAVDVEKSGLNSTVVVLDGGVGIFNKIQQALSLEAPEHAVLELAKGKFTTDPGNHTGEGIFFSSRAVDVFAILASGLFAVHQEGAEGDWILGEGDAGKSGTSVSMTLSDAGDRELNAVFDSFADPEQDFVFSKTIIPVDLVRYGDERVVSRSQAKRLMNRLERFHTVLLDFSGIESVGQAFADEIFRVFSNAHPHVAITYTGANVEVEKMIKRAIAGNVRQQ